MKSNSTFLETVLNFFDQARSRKFILPALIIISACMFVFGMVKVSQTSKEVFDKNIAIQQELKLTLALQEQERNIYETEILINNYLATNSKPDKSVFPSLLNIDFVLGEIKNNAEGNNTFEAILPVISLLANKVDVLNKTVLSLQNGKQNEALAIFNSQSYRLLQENLTAATGKLKSIVPAISNEQSADVHQEKTANLSWNLFTFLCCAMLICLVWIYLSVKARQNSESEKKLALSAEVKENFLANMSHEIRTPLNAVLGFANILRSTKLSSEQEEFVEVIQTSGDNLLSIVNDILDLSKIEAGMLRIEESPFRIQDIISTVESIFLTKAEEKKLKFLVNIDSDTPEIVSGDAVRLTQILVNLLANAIKFTEDGGVYLRVTPMTQKDGKIFLEFLVRDTGIGISAEKQAKIFDRFEQAEASTTRRFGGTGLGLSIVKNLVELQQGSIEIYSKYGVGTSFTVKIPYKMTNENVAKTDNKRITINPNIMRTDKKILIAEDNVMNQRLIKHLMNNWNFNYDLVFNGAQALEAVKKQNYALILMDIQMPEMDGYTATAVLRSELKSSIPVIAMTAHAMAGEKEKCLKAGMDDYLSKPINEEMLFEMIEKYTVKNLNEKVETSQPGTTTIINNQGGKVIDLNVIERYSKGNIQFKNELIQDFITTIPVSINSLESAIKDNNYTKIKEIVHDIKTPIHIMGLSMVIGHLLQKIESFAQTNERKSYIYQIFTDVKAVCLQAVQEAGRLVA